MRPRPVALVLVLGLGAVVAPAVPQQPADTSVSGMLTGTVYDALSGQPLRLATVRVVAAGASGLTDDRGRYQLALPPGSWQVDVRRIGYERAVVAVVVPASGARQDVYLRPVPIPLQAITITPAEDPARAIIARAIAHKREVLARIRAYRYAAYVKFVVRDLRKPPDSAASVVLITESRTAAYWEYPDRYQETILARRQSRNLDAADNLVSVGELVNFNRNRIDLRRYALVSPIADDALDHYGYHLLDTLAVDGRRVFRLAVEPKSQVSPLFAGVIDIADSSADVVSIDVGVNAATRFNYVTNLRYQQRLRDAGGGRWMPYEIRFSGEVRIGLPIPGFPNQLTFEHRAALEAFQFDEGRRPADLSQYRIVVDERADRPDSAVWTAPNALPLTPVERAAWARIDSTAHGPAGAGQTIARGVGLALWLGTNRDFFHFNRVDGGYLGAAWTERQYPGWVVTTKLGYAFGREAWQYRVGSERRLSSTRQLWVGWSYADETVRRPTLVSSGYNPTVRALGARLDPLDYYRERGLALSLRTRLFAHADIGVRYTDVRQSTLAVTTDYTLFAVTRLERPNPPIVDGHLRVVAANLTYDSRPMVRDKGVDYRLGSLAWTRVTLGAEVAAPDVIPTDFAFRRYLLEVERRQRTLNLGVTTLRGAVGIATGWVPPQHYFTVDFGMETATFQRNGFNTLAETNYSGTRAALVIVRHDFDRLLFVKSRLPLVRSLPFTLRLQGGVFWTDFIDHPPMAGDLLLVAARRPYTELGFGLGNLTPFLSPFNLAAHVTWQLSSYPTHRYRVGLGFSQ